MTPRSPLIVVGPVLVTVWPARTPKLSAVPRPTGGCAASAVLASSAERTTHRGRTASRRRAREHEAAWHGCWKAWSGRTPAITPEN